VLKTKGGGEVATNVNRKQEVSTRCRLGWRVAGAGPAHIPGGEQALVTYYGVQFWFTISRETKLDQH
jgi:hypothetical protein